MGVETLELVSVFAVGLALGAGYATMLWITVRRLPRMRYPAIELPVSAALRVVLPLAGLYLVMDGRWERLLIGLSGFVVARLIATRLAVRPNRSHP